MKGFQLLPIFAFPFLIGSDMADEPAVGGHYMSDIHWGVEAEEVALSSNRFTLGPEFVMPFSIEATNEVMVGLYNHDTDSIVWQYGESSHIDGHLVTEETALYSVVIGNPNDEKIEVTGEYEV
ncbi:hypothetical protein [Geomicrobium sp. JCM 19039]|uniref:hypothetical protein n=1 Tax=Geomicrobium sp. JCM 19039 TaxID=1460636 RepID=UPI00045F2BCC|nr:hypothetical protein [Geomicrobium sp. JCM 19039]GAK14125.1 hypothetical protein JCM19039_4022 [Geomicrobium sp. JCM 19039]